jgi:hypothetical protein
MTHVTQVLIGLNMLDNTGLPIVTREYIYQLQTIHQSRPYKIRDQIGFRDNKVRSLVPGGSGKIRSSGSRQLG